MDKISEDSQTSLTMVANIPTYQGFQQQTRTQILQAGVQKKLICDHKCDHYTHGRGLQNTSMHSEPDIGGYLCTYKPVHWVTNHKVHLIDIFLQSRVKVLNSMNSL